MDTRVSMDRNPSFAGRTLGDIARSLPGATAAFRRHKLDFCCGGEIALAEAATAKGLSLAEIEAELTAIAAASSPAEPPLATDELIDHIESRFHAAHRRELPELIRLARRVEAVHKDKPEVPHGLADLLARVAQELDSHMQKEEMILFPMMRRGGGPMIGAPISVMLVEHDDHGTNLRRLESLTNNFEPPEGACTTWRALYAGGRKFVDDVMEHIHTENNILFPRFTG
ncbi:MAG: iron-sulfur cluster repair protein YtfE [Alphaproteobacteria bacterium]|nr:iron-sulfur cluster repair protein YtfE [Alphaproteobacteria bacterium]MDE2111959.1 iron-sulfur cluster repair protein YtfE [Alphaproteobacteria bacterium]MDE2493006.1 iron-sulfur cluster repair protein YtfE [Alphaproteobacteria bacterium]